MVLVCLVLGFDAGEATLEDFDFDAQPVLRSLVAHATWLGA